MLLVLFWFSLYWSVTYIQKFLIRAMYCLFSCKTDWEVKSKFWITKKKNSVETLFRIFFLFTFFRCGQDISPQRLAWVWLLVLEKWLALEKVNRFTFQIFSWGQEKRTWKELWNFPSVCCFLYFEVCCIPVSVLTVRLAWIFTDVSLPKFIY